MSIRQRPSLYSVQSSFREYASSNDQLKDDSSTGTVQRYPYRSLSLASSEPRKLPLTVRNRNASDAFSWSSTDSVQARASSSEHRLQKHPSMTSSTSRLKTENRPSRPTLHDSNADLPVVDSIWQAKQKGSNVAQRNDAIEENNGSQKSLIKNPLKRWVKTLERRGAMKQKVVRQREERWSLFEEFEDGPNMQLAPSAWKGEKSHKKSSSWASSGFVTAVKSATISLTTMSAAPPSRGRSSLLARGSDQGSRRTSSLDHSTTTPVTHGQRIVDEAALERGHRRHNIIQEIVKTEEGYVADLKLLIDAYRTMSTRSPNINTSRITRNMQEILDLHERLLLCIRPILTYKPSYHHTFLHPQIHRPGTGSRSQSDDNAGNTADKAGRSQGRHSLEIAKRRKRQDDRAVADRPMADPEEAAQVALTFNDLIGQFFVYEEYGSRYAALMNQMAMAEKFHDMESFERGYEALANTIAPSSMREDNRRRGLTYRDLLMKPVQRVTRYPLLFSDLLNQTPVIDCPQSCSDVEKVLYRLRETVDEINKATNDDYAHERIQRSWKLQDLIVFPSTSSAPYAVRSLGHAKLCGALHAAYQTSGGVVGGYMICALFKSCLVLANRPKHHEKATPFEITASISLANLELHNCDNGTGLQCYTALFSWKIVFEADQHLYEIIFSACSRQEEDQWRKMIRYLADKETRLLYEDNPRAPEQYPRLLLRPSIHPFAEVFGQPGTIARRLSTRRPATVGAKTATSQVVIRNTHCARSSDRNTSEVAMGRSQTVRLPTRVPALAPRKLERILLEQEMSEVWTKELLPYPGMSSRAESSVRTSANSVMRRLSRATSHSFGRRSASYTGSSVSSKFYEDSGSEDTDSLRRVETRYGLMPLIESPASSTAAGAVTMQTVSSAHTESKEQSHDTRNGQLEDTHPHGTVLDEPRALTSERPHRLSKKRLHSSLSLIRTMSIDGMKAMFNHKENVKAQNAH